MDFAAGNGADTSHEGRQRSPEDFCAKDSTLPASLVPPSREEPAAMLSRLAREYYMLSDIATNMRSGFILLNSAEQVAYSNPSAERLLVVSSRPLVEDPAFNMPPPLVSLPSTPHT